jgi:hypothetical protein
MGRDRPHGSPMSTMGQSPWVTLSREWIVAGHFGAPERTTTRHSANRGRDCRFGGFSLLGFTGEPYYVS